MAYFVPFCPVPLRPDFCPDSISPLLHLSSLFQFYFHLLPFSFPFPFSTYSLIPTFFHSYFLFSYLFIDSFVCLNLYSFIYLFNYLFIYLFIYSFTYSFILSGIWCQCRKNNRCSILWESSSSSSKNRPVRKFCQIVSFNF